MRLTSLAKRYLVIVVVLLQTVACQPEQQPTTGVSLHAELGGGAEGFERACGPRQFSFPEDHGAHPSFRNEWWYVTGNIEGQSGQKFGFHITFFRIANEPLTQSTSNNASSWSSNQFYMAHFAVTAEGREIKKYERFARSAAGLAGANINANGNTVTVWLDDWQLSAQQNKETKQLDWQLSLKAEDSQLNLTLTPQKPIVLQGDAGYSQKSADPCNSSYYYSVTRLQATGKLDLDGTNHNVTGSAWLDREWSSSALGDDQTGWDWFAMQFDDGTEMMLYQLRQNDGSKDPHSHAVEIDLQGKAHEIPIDQIEINITRWWQSETGNSYPVAGEISRSDTGQTIVFQPLIDNQELDLTVRYWEGAIGLTTDKGVHIGRGYMELTGY